MKKKRGQKERKAEIEKKKRERKTFIRVKKKEIVFRP
jgi:hypothetical protein